MTRDKFFQHIGCRVAEKRRYRRLSIDALAEASGIPADELRNLEQGEADIRLSELMNLSMALDESPSQFLSIHPSHTCEYPEPEVIDVVMKRVREHVAQECDRNRRFGKKKFWEQLKRVHLPNRIGRRIWGMAFENTPCSCVKIEAFSRSNSPKTFSTRC